MACRSPRRCGSETGRPPVARIPQTTIGKGSQSLWPAALRSAAVVKPGGRTYGPPYPPTALRRKGGNFVPLNERVEWTKEFTDMLNLLEDSDVEPNFTDIIVPIFVYSVKREIAANEVEEIKTFLKACRDLTGIFPIIVLTHKTSGPFFKFRDLFEGMGAEEIFSVENYTSEDNLKTLGRHLQFLNLILKVLLNVNFRMSEERNPRKERAERKKFLAKYFHERETQK